ncbi:MAG: CoA pyrophosphatase [Thermodesulfobacteriota bacterium]|nr:CoA pyrophosphatase [Thermodesulfobacteriota bacterium]MEE2974912.1 CoA pyrophosphatase [Thermodesulfobacteriota bacterium]|tara:strand:+ start:113 stop:730 length:618 start_codon:yes stop_codon:yes gene_type:complete
MNLSSDSAFIEKLRVFFQEIYFKNDIARDKNSILSSVAIIIRNHEEIYEILFIKRSEREYDNFSGHMAFPGGINEKIDKTGLDTSIRETYEEIGIDLKKDGLFLGQFSDYRPVNPKSNHLIVSPYIFFLKNPTVKINLNQEEVVDTVWIDLKILLELSINSKRTTEKYNQEYQDYVFNYKGYNIWGMTGKILYMFINELKKINNF